MPCSDVLTHLSHLFPDLILFLSSWQRVTRRGLSPSQDLDHTTELRFCDRSPCLARRHPNGTQNACHQGTRRNFLSLFGTDANATIMTTGHTAAATAPAGIAYGSSP
jgi:hypothetical protein